MAKPINNGNSPKQPLAAKAYELLAKKIICLEYQPSQNLEENQLMDDLGIGRTPIREAWCGSRVKEWWNPIPTKG